MKRKRWKYTVYYANYVLGTFTSRAKAREFMKNMTDFDLPFIITPDLANQTAYMIGTLK